MTEQLSLLFLGTPVWMWLAFLVIVATLLVLDLGALHRGQREIGVRESLALSINYVTRRVRMARALGRKFEDSLDDDRRRPAAHD